ncbi:MAG: AbrB/MazE/SpoVT family DNA-binding domain-containing protein [Bacteroidetes bacterium]|nr:AbrB/MazE/SpoVT family DNA-binding domain-containing protein [Bacteroidota bacterium]
MSVDTAKIFLNGKSQAVRLPKAYRLQGKEAYISKIGDAIILFHKKEKREPFFSNLEKFSDDFIK